MKSFKSIPTTLTIALGLSLAGVVVAQSAAPTAVANDELAVARAELARAAQRVAELSRRDGVPTGAPLRGGQRMLRKPVIGVLLARSADTGVRVAGVTPGSAAAEAGLKSGDVLLAIGGRKISGDSGSLRYDHAHKLLTDLDIRRPLQLDYLRDGKTASVAVTPKLDDRVFVLNSADGSLSKWDGNVMVRRGPRGEFVIEGSGVEVVPDPGDMHESRTEIIRANCGGNDCKRPVLLAEAFRWNGLNLASVDAQLGRYFGARSGVLVLSAGRVLAPLQAGDVIQNIEGKSVTTPREAMEVLRARPAGGDVAIGYLRDRKPANLRVKVPTAMSMPMPPPPPPAPPAPPRPPTPPLIGAAGAPAAPQNIRRLTTVIVNEDGRPETWIEEVRETAGINGRIEKKRKVMIVDSQGRTHEQIDTEDGPPPAPPIPRTPPLPPPPPPPGG